MSSLFLANLSVFNLLGSEILSTMKSETLTDKIPTTNFVTCSAKMIKGMNTSSQIAFINLAEKNAQDQKGS